MITEYELRPDAIPAQMKAIVIPAGARKQVVLQLTESDGSPVHLQQEKVEDGFPAPDFSPEQPVSSVHSVVRLRVIDALGDALVLFDKECEIVDGESGKVSVIIDNSITGCAGIYHGDVGLFAGDNLTRTWPVRMIVERNAFNPGKTSGLTVPEIRMAIMDIPRSEDDYLLDEVEFTDDDIANAARRVIDLWNETPPVVLRATHRNFPYREWWLVGTLSFLYAAAAARYRRNSLTYSAGGVTVDDKNKSAEYQQMSMQLRAEFLDWAKQTKYAHNMRMCWSSGL